MTCVALCGCVGIDYDHKAAAGLRTASSVAIVRNPDVDDQFLDSLTSWFSSHRLQHRVVDQPPASGWSLAYGASWSWDFAFYLSDVRITANHNGTEAGYATYNVFAGAFSLDMGKWKKDGTVVGELLSRLYGGKPTPQQSSAAALSAADGLGTLLLTSNVAGAAVYVDGAFVGNAPATLKLTAGDHNIRVLTGGELFYEQAIRVMAGSQASLSADK